MQKNIIITLVLSILIAIFAILNAGAIPVNLIFTTVNLSAALVILISASFGAIIVYLFDTVSKRRTSKVIKEYEKRILVLNNEQQDLKAKHDDTLEELKVLKEQIDIVNQNLEIIEEQ